MCKKCEAIVSLTNSGDRKSVTIFDAKYNGLGHVSNELYGAVIGEKCIAELKTIVHANGKAYVTSMNIHNCPFCGERLV